MSTDLLYAEAIAWPLASAKLFDAASSGWEPCRLDFQVRARDLGHPSREADLAVDACWQAPFTISDHLRRHARRVLRPGGAVTTLVHDDDLPGAEISRWRWLSLCLPPLLLIAAATPADRHPRPLQLLDPAVAPMQPVAHLHLHAGAVFPFELLWSRLGSSLDLGRLRRDDSPPCLGGSKDFARWLIRAFLARRYLASRLLATPLDYPGLRFSPHRLVNQALRELEIGRLPTSVMSRDQAYDETVLRRTALRWDSSNPVQAISEVWDRDPIGDGAEVPEARFLHAALHRIDQLDNADRRLFDQYLRVKVALFRHLRSDPASIGLSPFVMTYGRISHYRSDLEGLALDIAADEPELTVGAVELRTQPELSCDRLLDLVAPRVRTARPAQRAGAEIRSREWGFVLHFLRYSADDERRSRFAPGPHYRRYRDHLAREHVFVEALRRWPQLLHVFRGLDVAGDERPGPLWLALPMLQRLRRLSEQLSARHPGLTPLRLTLHAGEDYGHLLTGLRSIHEPFLWGLLRPGDRLGHAISLGIQPEAWAGAGGPVRISRWDRLNDLLWLGAAPSRLGVPQSEDQRVRAKREVRSLAREIWARDVPLEDLVAMGMSFGDEDLLRRIGLANPVRTAPSGQAAEDLLGALFYEQPVWKRASEEIPVSRDLDVRYLGPLQIALRRLVARMRVCVELNPSSNLLVAGLPTLLDEPVFRLRPTDPSRDDIVPVTLSADDPVSFCTGLADEHAYAWAGMVAHGSVGPTYATSWLEEAGRTSWRYRFTVPASARLGELLVPGLGDRVWRSGGHFRSHS